MGADVGNFNYVSVDYTISIDTLGKESMIPCEAENNLVYDECAESQVLKAIPNCELPWVILMFLSRSGIDF